MGGLNKICFYYCNIGSLEGNLRSVVNTVIQHIFNNITDVKIPPSKLVVNYTF